MLRSFLNDATRASGIDVTGVRVINRSDDAAASQLNDVFARVSDVLEDLFGRLPERGGQRTAAARVCC